MVTLSFRNQIKTLGFWIFFKQRIGSATSYIFIWTDFVTYLGRSDTAQVTGCFRLRTHTRLPSLGRQKRKGLKPHVPGSTVQL